jgi:hypothetical protein
MNLASKGLINSDDVTVQAVFPGGAAIRAGLRGGDVIVKVGGVTLLGKQMAEDYLTKNVAWGKPLALTIRRGVPQPYAGHPRLDLFVGSMSPHKVGDFGCTICHGRNAIIHKWTFGYPQPNAVYGSKDGEHPFPAYPVMKKSPYMKEAILCGQCHGLGPNFEQDNPSQCGTLYGSYLWAYRAEGGDETCQDCHMHKSKLGHNMQSYRAPEMYKTAIDFKAEAYAYIWRDVVTTTPMGLVTVELTNKAGHAIPDG